MPLDALTLSWTFDYNVCNGEPTSVPRWFTLDLDLLNRQRATRWDVTAAPPRVLIGNHQKIPVVALLAVA